MWQARAVHPCLAVLLLTAGASEGGAATRTWDGAASPCGATLQDCINGALPGDIVRVATNTPILENLTIDKSLTLRAAAGFTPLLDNERVVQITNPSPRANSILFEGFTFTRGRVRAVQLSAGAFDVTLRSLTFLDVPVARSGIEITTGNGSTFGAFTFSITDNEMSLLPESSVLHGETAIMVFNEDAFSMRGVVRNNRIDHFAPGQQGAIELTNNDKNLEVDVIGNDIRGAGYNAGIAAAQSFDGTSRFRILDNLIVGQTSVAGAASSIIVRATAGDCDFEIVNNTVVNGDDGIRVDGGGGPTDSTSGVVANNIVSNMAQVGILLDPSHSNVVERNNLIDASPLFDFVPGPGTLLRDPHFIGGSNYRLGLSSPARNAGDDASVPTDLITDLDGGPRRIGHVDMGAYESTITVSSPPLVAEDYRLHPNVPNPFNPSTTICYELPRAERVRLGVFDATGRVVRWLVMDATQNAGTYRYVWNGQGGLGVPVASGVYFYHLEAGRFVDSQRMVLAR